MPSQPVVIVAGHAICTDPSAPRAGENWILLPFQRNEIEGYIGHLEAGVRAAAGDPSALLVFSGGYTRAEAGPRSEAQSYFWIADRLGWFGHPEVRTRAITEEFARDSFENLLYSICRVREYRQSYPSFLTLVSWEFKRQRFDLHRASIRWPESRYRFLGPNDPPDLAQALVSESRNRRAYQADPYSSSPAFQAKREARNPYRRTPGYLEHCPELRALMGHAEPEFYAGPLPWS